MKSILSHRPGFTLVELLIVVAIIGILAAAIALVPEARVHVDALASSAQSFLADPMVLGGALMLGRLKVKREELQAKQDKLHKVFEEAKTENDELDLDKVKSLGEGLSTIAKSEKIRAMNDELTALGKEVQALEEAEKALKDAKERGEKRSRMVHPGGDEPDERKAIKEQKSIGELFVASEAFKSRVKNGDGGPASELDFDVKTLMQTGAGWAPESIRTGRVVEKALEPLNVMDLIPFNTTGQNAVVYMEETTATNAAAETDEAGDYAESTLALTERSSPVRKIATFIPVTDEQLEDVAQVQGYIDRRLRYFIMDRLEAQVLVGDGNAPNLTGILSTGSINSQAKGADPIPDAIYKGMTAVRVTGRANPGAVIIHPTNWQSVRLLRTNDGVYIWGNPSEAGPERIWGLAIAQSSRITLGTALVGDFANFCEYNERRGIVVKISDSHSDWFVKGKQAVRADVRGAFVVYRPAAFSEITGL